MAARGLRCAAARRPPAPRPSSDRRWRHRPRRARVHGPACPAGSLMGAAARRGLGSQRCPSPANTTRSRCPRCIRVCGVTAVGQPWWWWCYLSFGHNSLSYLDSLSTILYLSSICVQEPSKSLSHSLSTIL
nr:uncharacterized protein LOC127292050 [Lolium perenne]